MANPYTYGFRPAYNRSGVGHETPVRMRIASAYAPTVNGTSTGIGVGDVVKLVNDGTVALAAVGDAVFGVIIGVEGYYDSTGSIQGPMITGSVVPSGVTYGTNYSRETAVLVQPAFGMRFWALSDDASTATTYVGYRALINENVDINLVAVSSRQAPLIDISTHGTANTLAFRIVDIPGPDSQVDWASLYVPLLIEVNLTQNAGLMSATGV